MNTEYGAAEQLKLAEGKLSKARNLLYTEN